MFSILFLIYKWCYNLFQFISLLIFAFSKYEFKRYVCGLIVASMFVTNSKFLLNVNFPYLRSYMVTEGSLCLWKYITLYVLNDMNTLIAVMLVSSYLQLLYIVFIGISSLKEETYKRILINIPVEGEYEVIGLV